MAFNKEVVSAFVKPLPHLVDVGGLTTWHGKSCSKNAKNWLKKGFCITFAFHEIKAVFTAFIS